MKIHAVHVVRGGIPKDKRKKVSVMLILVIATDRGHAMVQAAKCFEKHSDFSEYTFWYRNEFQEDEYISWAFQSWDITDFYNVAMKTGQEILSPLVENGG